MLTWVMTASLAVTLVLCAHGLGTFLRQPHPSMAERRWVMVLITLPVLAIIAIALIRARYLAVAAELTGLDTLGPVVGSAGVPGHQPARLHRRHDAVLPGARTPKDRRGGGARRDRSSRSAVASRSSPRRPGASASTRSASRGRRRVASEALRVDAGAGRPGLIAYHRGLMAAYSTANMRARGNPEMPDALRELPAIEVPEVLRELAARRGGAAG